MTSQGREAKSMHHCATEIKMKFSKNMVTSSKARNAKMICIHIPIQISLFLYNSRRRLLLFFFVLHLSPLLVHFHILLEGVKRLPPRLFGADSSVADAARVVGIRSFDHSHREHAGHLTLAAGG